MPALTERSAVDLAAAIHSRKLTASEVVEAHIELLEQANPRLNAIVADRFEQARAEARAVDQRIAMIALRSEDFDELPPLLGVPFTVKESIALDGMPNTAGVLARREHRASHTATAVKRLVEAGAIPLGVTNTSELTLWIESENPVYGRTNNPYDPSRTAGGSSGGEGAAVGSGGSVFGVGADIGGSIRIPALFCGVFGHKPSAGLIPNTGMWPSSSGEAARMLAIGPLARRAEDLMPLLRDHGRRRWTGSARGADGARRPGRGVVGRSVGHRGRGQLDQAYRTRSAGRPRARRRARSHPPAHACEP